jgi:hypothetical protein
METLNNNKRHQTEYRLVTDGEQLYRLHPVFKVPKGMKEVFYHMGEKVYTSTGKLKPMFRGLTRVQPRINKKLLTRTITSVLDNGN